MLLGSGIAPVQTLALEKPYAKDEALKSRGRKKKKEAQKGSREVKE